jgi:GR25 family glycosyltransferase involved in LPS biosynthesis
VRNHFRGDQLGRRLEEFKFEPKIVWGPDIDQDLKFIQSKTNQAFAKFSINREIKQTEIACSLGHIRMYEIFLKSFQEWGLFLEDDAICIKNPQSFLNSLPKTKQPVQIFLHDGLGTNLKRYEFSKLKLKNLGLTRRLDPQYGAYGYMLNKSAVELILNSKITRLISNADWPYLWPRKIRFYIADQVYFTHPKDTNESIIGVRLNANMKLKSHFPDIFRIIKGLRFGINFCEIMHKEFTLKLLRITLQIKRKVWN